MRSIALGNEDVARDRFHQGHQRGRAGADPVGQCGDIEIDALLGVDLDLPVERQMRPVLGRKDLGQQLRPGAAAGDRVRRRRRLGDGLAFATGELLAHVLDDLPLRRDVLQGVGDVLAQLPQRPAAAGAGRGCWVSPSPTIDCRGGHAINQRDRAYLSSSSRRGGGLWSIS
jgi:hypothetical protein